MSAIALAHMGDAVYETLVRTWLCVHGTATGKDLHRATIALVCAPAQAEKMQKVLPLLAAATPTSTPCPAAPPRPSTIPPPVWSV